MSFGLRLSPLVPSPRSLALASLAAMVLVLSAGPGASGATFDLHLRPYCAPGTFCGHASEQALRDFVCQATEELNVEYEPTGFSFRPTLMPVDSTGPDVSVNPQGQKNRYWEVSGCAGGDADAALRLHWLGAVAKANPEAITIMLTPAWNRCCSGIPRTNKPLGYQYGIFCDANPARGVYGTGTAWAHEMGHHWSLSHTHGGCPDAADGQDETFDADAAIPLYCSLTDALGNPVSCTTDTDCQALGLGSCKADQLPAVTDTPPDPCTFERCDGKCQDSGGTRCTSDADCPSGTTPCACDGADEDLQGTLRNDHVWVATRDSERAMNPTADFLSEGSPHVTWCRTELKRHGNGTTTASDSVPPIEVASRNALSYHGDGGVCRGPYVVSGSRRLPFTPVQLARIAACRSQIWPRDAAHLPDVCQNRGEDEDHDGICGNDDNCPLARNTCQTDTDGDGIGDACDLCPFDPTPTGDLDGDGIGDVCDEDRDGDGCLNDGDDDDPDVGWLPIERHVQIGCSGGEETVWAWLGEDLDGDDVASCRDFDDDGDGICDSPGPGCGEARDPCPEKPGISCVTVGAVDCPPPWAVCLGSGCVEHFLKFVRVINPDPTRNLVFERFSILNRTIYAAALAGRTAAESAAALTALAVGAGTAGPAAVGAAEERIRVEIWRRADAFGGPRLVAVVGEYDAAGLRLGDIARGGFVRMTPLSGEAGDTLDLETTYAIGSRAADAMDGDGDGVPDVIDNCTAIANGDQADADGDGFGNACDPDLDGDGSVGPPDVARVRGCAGADLGAEVPVLEPASFDGEGLGPPAAEPDALAVALAAVCRAADLDGDGHVGAADAARAGGLLGSRPGPSAVRRGNPPPPPPFAPLCGSRTAMGKPKAVVKGLDLPAGSQKVRLAGELTVPFPFHPEPDPAANGVSAVLVDTGGHELLAVRIPGGAYDAARGEGWKPGKQGTSARWKSEAGIGGITKVVVGWKPGRRPGAVKVLLSGKGASLAVGNAVLPLRWEVNLDPDAAATLQCGAGEFREGPARPACAVKKSGAVLFCG